MSTNELYHHGIDGQRWGVRHGPPYPLDRADHNKVVEKSKKSSEKRHLSYVSSRKHAKRMTDADLNATIDRLQREETYRRLVSGEKTANKLAKKQLKATKQSNKIRKEEQKLARERFEEEKKNNSLGRKVTEKAVLVATQAVINKLTGDWLKKLDEKKPDEKPKDEDKPKNQNEDALNAQNKKNEENARELKRRQELDKIFENMPSKKEESKRITDGKKSYEPLSFKTEEVKRITDKSPRSKERSSIYDDWQDHSLNDSYWDTKADDVLKNMQMHAQYKEDTINKYLLEWGG